LQLRATITAAGLSHADRLEKSELQTRAREALTAEEVQPTGFLSRSSMIPTDDSDIDLEAHEDVIGEVDASVPTRKAARKQQRKIKGKANRAYGEVLQSEQSEVTGEQSAP
jgi:hypothetical protein